jgi:hypothetical protein
MSKNLQPHSPIAPALKAAVSRVSARRCADAQQQAMKKAP